MKAEDTLIITSRQTNFEETEFIRKNALLDWIKQQLSFEQGFDNYYVQYGYKKALEEMENYLNKDEEICTNNIEWIDMDTLECHCYDCCLFDNGCKDISLCKRPRNTYKGFYKEKK